MDSEAGSFGMCVDDEFFKKFWADFNGDDELGSILGLQIAADHLVAIRTEDAFVCDASQ